MISVSEALHYIVIVSAIYFFIITVINIRFIEYLIDPNKKWIDEPFNDSVSVLVPARNEEDGISDCLRALSIQTYDPIEILILDDRSTDRTAEIIKSFADSDPRIKMISGSEPPEGWLGKHWACDQLFQEANGDLLLFMDADTILSERTVAASVHESNIRKADLLTVMPQRIATCITERLMFPFLDWIVFSGMPMAYAHRSSNQYLSAAFGQFMLFRREAYKRTGGHAEIRSNPLDDFTLGRIIKKLGLTWVLYQGTESVQTLGYKGDIEAFRGISRSVFPAINYRVSVFILFSVILTSLSFLPLATLVASVLLNQQSTELLVLSTMSLGMIIISWAIVCRKFKHSVLAILFYPLSVAVIIVLAWHSFITYTFGVADWKNRRILGQKIRL